MYTKLIAVVASLLVIGCATGQKSSTPEHNFSATSLSVDLTSNGSQVIDAIPAESAMDSFETIDSQGRVISYAALTDTDTGALVFVNQKLHGTLSHHDAQAFYICRGYATTATQHWAQEARDWADSLLVSSKPASAVELKFSGKPTMQSLKEVAESPFIKRLKSLFGMGTNPLNIFGSLSTMQSDMEMSNQFDKVKTGLDLIRPGMSESSVDEVSKPEDIAFVSGGTVMVYPSQLVEYFIAGGDVKAIQRPSFYFLRKTHAALFYAPNVKWSLCTPASWKEALPETP